MHPQGEPQTSSGRFLRRQDLLNFINTLYEGDLHAKRVLSLANATLGVLTSASLAIHAVGTSRPNSCVSEAGAAPRRPSSPSPRRCSPPSTYILRDGTTYRDLGGDYFDRLDKQRALNNLLRRVRRLGYDVTLTATPQPSGVSS